MMFAHHEEETKKRAEAETREKKRQKELFWALKARQKRLDQKEVNVTVLLFKCCLQIKRFCIQIRQDETAENGLDMEILNEFKTEDQNDSQVNIEMDMQSC